MPDARSLMEEIGRDLESVERGHPYLAELETGRIRREDTGPPSGARVVAARPSLSRVR